MTVRKLDKGAWQQYFDYMSRGLEGIQAEIAVAALPLGDQIETEWLPVLGITYDPKGDVLEIALDGIDHLIYKPREIYVDATAGELMSLEIVDGESGRQVVKLREPLMLPAPGTQRHSETQTRK